MLIEEHPEKISWSRHCSRIRLIKQILGFDGLPEKGSIEYYVAMAHRDRIIRGSPCRQ